MQYRHLKLKLNKKQNIQIEEWLQSLTAIWNWAIRKIELDFKNNIHYSKFDFINLLSNSSKKLNIPSHTIQAMLASAHTAYERHFTGNCKKPKFKGHRNKLNWILFSDPIPKSRLQKDRIRLPLLNYVRFHKQEIPEGNIKCARLLKKPSGWYLNIVLDSKFTEIKKINHNQIGIDLGYKILATFSNGEKIDHPKELQRNLHRIGQAQRGRRKKLVARLHERVANQKKDRNHKLSRRLVSENDLIAVSKDNINGLAKSGLGKSVSSANHYQLKQMLKYKSSNSGTLYLEVSGFNSTKTCSQCGILSGPTGRIGLSVRQWVCSACGANHDRDVNAAINTLKAALGSSVEGSCKSERQEFIFINDQKVLATCPRLLLS